MNVLVLLGSTRKVSFNARLADAAVAALPADTVVGRFDITRLPFYDADADAAGELGEAVAEFRRRVAAADAVLIATPVYNGGMAASVKNAIDVASRPRPGAPITDTPVGVVTAALHPRAVGVLDQVRLSTRIAGAAPLEHGVVALLGESFDPEGRVGLELRGELADYAAELLAAARGSSPDGRASAA